jgi:hypothetical protein
MHDYRLFLALFPVVLVSTHILPAYSSDKDDFYNQFDTIKYVVTINQANLIVIERHNSVYLPLKATLSSLSFSSGLKQEQKLIFTKLTPYTNIEIDVDSCIKKSNCFYEGQVIYIRSTALSELANLTITTNLRTLNLELSSNNTTHHQPAIQELYIEDQYSGLTYPSVAVRMSYNQDWSAYSNLYLDVLYNQVSIRDNRLINSNFSSTSYNIKRDFDYRYIDSYEVGDINTTDYQLVANSKEREGFYIGKREGISKNIQDIVGYSDPFSQVELYDESVLLGFVVSNSVGRFEFKDIFIGQESRRFYVNKFVNKQLQVETFQFNSNKNKLVSQEWGYSFYTDYNFNYTIGSLTYNLDESHSLELGAANDSELGYFNPWVSLSKEGDSYSLNTIVSKDKTGNYAYWLDYALEMPVTTIVGRWYSLSPEYVSNWTGRYQSEEYFNIDLYYRFLSSSFLRRFKFGYQWYTLNNKEYKLFTLDTGFNIGSYFLSAEVDYQEHFRGILALSGYWRQTTATIQANFIEKKGLNSAQLKVRTKLSNDLNLNFSYNHSVKNKNYSAGLNLNYNSGPMTIGGGYIHTNYDNIFTFQIGIAFSLGAPLNLKNKISDQTLVNLYAKHDEENTQFITSELVSSQYHSIDTKNFSKDHDLVGRSNYDQVVINSHPGSELDVYIPYITTCSIEGYITAANSTLSISLEKHGSKGENKVITLFDDGYYYIEELEKGSYSVFSINVDSEQTLIGIMDISMCSKEYPIFEFDYKADSSLGALPK